MRRFRVLLGLAPMLPVAALVATACDQAPVSIGLVLKTPAGLLDQATSVSLDVFDAKLAKCLPTGHIDKTPTGAGVQTFELQKQGCAGGAAFCQQIVLDKDGSEKMFAVVAKGAGNTILAEGCTKEVIDQDPLQVDIKIQRYNPPGCCNDGMLQTGEQCDPGQQAMNACDGSAGGACKGVPADQVCRCDCTTEELLLSTDNPDTPPLTNGAPGTKKELSLAFCPGTPKTANGLHTVYTNTEQSGGGDIHVRVLSSDLYTITDPPMLQLQLRLPLKCGNVGGVGIPREQKTASITPIGTDTIGIVFASDINEPGVFETFLSRQTSDGCADKEPDPIVLSANPASTPQPGAEHPDAAAGPEGSLLAAWTRDGGVFGRIWKTSGELLPPAGELGLGTSGTNPRVAGNKDGWVVVYQGSGMGDGDGVFLRKVAVDGTPGQEMRVNTVTEGPQDQPDVAMLEDGRFIVVWHDADDDIHFQRFDASGKPLIGPDEQGKLNTTTMGAQTKPAAAAGLGFFAVAWEDVNGTISARYAGASTGFGYNSISGQNDAFQASRADIQGDRHLPAVAIGGGSGGHVVIGWQDDDTNHHGVYVRRFPLPSTSP